MSSMPIRRRLIGLGLAAALAGCAPKAPPQPAPAPTTAPARQPATAAPGPEEMLQPSAAALRTASHIKLSGLELGTMWTYEHPPLDYWKKTYDFAPTQQWLDHVRLSSLKFDQICSASFVSPDGLIATNHHCGRECVEAQSKGGTDYVEQGFYAPTRKDEKVCPDLYVDQLVSMEDVTQRLQAASPAGATEAAAQAAIDSATRAIESACDASTKLHCQVVSLYHGGEYHLYRYRRYSPVKLVFAPELQTGFFGGDPDNFTYPRYALDITFVRAYQPDGATPAHTPDYLQWNAAPVHSGDLVFVSGNPGSTERLTTLAQLEYEKVYRHPFLMAFLQAQHDLLEQVAKRGPQAEQQVRQNLFEVDNSLKAYTGEEAGLQDSLLMGHKIAWEKDFQRRVNADPQLKAQYGDVWSKLADLQARKLELSPQLNLARLDLFPEPYVQVAGTLVRLVREKSLPEAQRSKEFQGGGAEQVQSRLEQQVPLEPQTSIDLLAKRLELLSRFVPDSNPILRQAIHPGETAEAAARRLITGSRVGDVAFRKALIEAGPAALDTVSDPLVRLAAAMEASAAELQPKWQAVQAEESQQEARLAHALFGAYGSDLPPDATFTLRISGGLVSGYPYNGTEAPYRTVIGGLYARSAEFDNAMPFTLPKSWADARAQVDMTQPLDMVSTNDITGGNSGSPVVDREGRIVGLAFDNNIEALPAQFLYPSPNGRTVNVTTSGITEALRSVYHATALVKELLAK